MSSLIARASIGKVLLHPTEQGSAAGKARIIKLTMLVSVHLGTLETGVTIGLRRSDWFYRMKPTRVST